MDLRLGLGHDGLVLGCPGGDDLDAAGTEDAKAVVVARPEAGATRIGGVALLDDVAQVVAHEGDGQRLELASLEGQPFYPFRHIGVKLGALL